MLVSSYIVVRGAPSFPTVIIESLLLRSILFDSLKPTDARQDAINAMGTMNNAVWLWCTRILQSTQWDAREIMITASQCSWSKMEERSLINGVQVIGSATEKHLAAGEASARPREVFRPRRFVMHGAVKETGAILGHVSLQHILWWCQGFCSWTWCVGFKCK